MLITQMTPAQSKALELYLEVDSEYNAPSFPELSRRLSVVGFSVSKSTLQRWSKEFEFEHHLKRHVNALILADKENYERLKEEAGAENLKKTLISLEDNNELVSGSFLVLKLILEQLTTKIQTKKQELSKEDKKLVLQIYSVASARDDKLLDRQAALGAIDKITKADLLKQLANTGVDIEEIQEEFTDVELEDE